VLVFHDAVGLSTWSPPFAEQFGDVRGEMHDAVSDYVEAVQGGEFPADDHSHEEEELDGLY